MKKIAILLSAALVVVAAFVFGRGENRHAGLVPLTETIAQQATKLPEGSIAISASDYKDLQPPFQTREDPASPNFRKLVIPKGAEKLQGSVQYEINTPLQNSYAVWVRARWGDSCRNSLRLGIDGSEPKVIGQDAVYGTWHWVRSGDYQDNSFRLSAGKHQIVLLGRDDGVEFDQLLVTPDLNFIPPDAAIGSAKGPELRRFSDSFGRAPGHGTDAWDRRAGNWEFQWAVDTDAATNQYGFIGTATSEEAQAIIKEPAWNGYKFAFSIRPRTKGSYGALLEITPNHNAMHVALDLLGDKPLLRVTGAGIDEKVDLGDRARLDQWHRIVIERWAWILRVLVDDHLVFENFNLPHQVGQVGLFVAAGSAGFDDMDVLGIPFQADDGHDYFAPWTIDAKAKWFRPAKTGSVDALIGRTGRISLASTELPVQEVVLDESTPALCEVEGLGLELALSNNGLRCFRASIGATPPMSVSLHATEGETHIHRLAVRYKHKESDSFTFGFYRFDSRQRNMYGDVTKWPIYDDMGWVSPWGVQGLWTAETGTLWGWGPGAVWRHEEPLSGLLDMRMQVRLANAMSSGEVELYGGSEPGLKIRLCAAPETEANIRMHTVTIPPDGKGHDLKFHVENDAVQVLLDNLEPQRVPFIRRGGDRVYLRVARGGIGLEDAEFVVQSRSGREFFYSFDRRETDWWRGGGLWLDHAGISCQSSTNWVSLLAPDGRGIIWNKRIFPSDLEVAFNVQQYSTVGKGVFGDKYDHHVHHPYDNICAVLGMGENFDAGYRLEVHSRDRSATVLYRDGQEVARVEEDKNFPGRYRGAYEHHPYLPLLGRIRLVKRGGAISAIVNGKVVLKWDDPSPLPVTTVGVGGHSTQINFNNIEIIPQE